ncbi:unnamed protein product [Rhizophagus irregularis]|nr:unnamed protein product [Rhizophagus irregularis]CAB5306313.1 unnamed protein product [Rhizophagus irregularis]
MQNDVISIIQKGSNTTEDTPKNINKKLNQILGTQHDDIKFLDFCSLALEAKINTNFSKISKQIFGFSECNATNACEKAKNIGKKDKLNESENMDRYFKSPHQQIKQLKQNKQQSKKNNITNSQEDQMVEFGDTSLELDSVQPENLKNEISYYQNAIE